jgi:putative ABC transport system permease protein
LSGRDGLNPGSALMLMGYPFKVIGVVDTGGGAGPWSAGGEALRTGERAAFVPCTTAALWQERTDGRVRTLDAVFVRAAVPERALRIALRLLREGDGGGSRAYTWITQEAVLRGVRRLQSVIAVTVGGIALLCMVLGGVTLMSLMVANVRDRVAEIGLRRALGARPADIVLLFVTEALLLAGAAALAATTLTHALLLPVRANLPVPLVFNAATFAVPVCLSVLLGAFFAWGPAAVAARISPAEALRSE